MPSSWYNHIDFNVFDNQTKNGKENYPIVISVDGMSFSGKTILCSGLISYFKEHKIDLYASKFPTKSEIGMLFKNHDLWKGNLHFPFEIMRADRAWQFHMELKEVIKEQTKNPKLKVLILERSLDSLLAMASMCNINLEKVAKEDVRLNWRFPKPDLAIILKVGKECFYQRKKQREEEGKLSKFDRWTNFYREAEAYNNVFNYHVLSRDYRSLLKVSTDHLKDKELIENVISKLKRLEVI
ncbi:MAG TPA: hypothetical protein PLA41_01465 [Candidatus Pacearchaeota archaeon]|nr:hypothetical protein [Candidatus Parcubacteria bacterium]HNZ84070.1 hypothetical protein [Candidatus Pacearchaeota archaeon]HOU45799.1 hypothetical protein [Candidatus Pacearchaeota archaeon]HPM08603.1 hypothetical protein [Candidatus Pacearchaeota archaeon]HQI74528.1 hypothetical protein [Candidatus Pacearchaeota archaeon]